MTEFERGLIDLVKSSITGCEISLPDNFDWEKAYKLALRHQITPMLYYGILNSMADANEDVLTKIELDTFKAIAVSTKQIYEIERICEKFRENGVEYLPLKGTLLKSIYPKPEIRVMSDADILIKTEQYDKIKPIMLELGFDEKVESDHEIIWNKKGVLLLELHKRLIPSYNKDFYAYFGDGWRLARTTDGCRYEMADEDNLIYLFTHYAKHYRDGGIGIRHLTDLYVFLNKKQNINKKYVEKELEKLQLLEFYKNSMRTLSVWFDGTEADEITDFITTRIMESSSYGRQDKKVISSAVKTSKTTANNRTVKFKKLISLIFLPYSHMCQKYPFLKKHPVLLPFMWVVRWITAIAFKRNNIKKEQENLRLMSEENISKYQRELNLVGLDFNFQTLREETKKMTEFERCIIDLIKSGITGQPAIIPKDFDWQEAYRFCLKHKATAIVYYGIINSKIKLEGEATGLFEQEVYKSVYIDQNQSYEINRITEEFQKNNIDYMLLKGSVLKKMYPKREMRYMGDADILIKTEQYTAITEIMTGLGFTEQYTTNHELAWKKKNILIELHSNIVDPSNKTFKEYYGNEGGWIFAEQSADSKNAYCLSAEENFIFLFAHFTKHFIGSGIGVLHITDLWVFLKNNPNISMEYIGNKFSVLGLSEFYQNIMNLIDVWFNGGQNTEITALITEKIFFDGIHGNKNNLKIAEYSGNSKLSKYPTLNKIVMLFCRLFPGYAEMCKRFSVLKKCPVLLPVFWIVRLIGSVFNYKSHLNSAKDIIDFNTSQTDKYEKLLNLVGIPNKE